MTIVTERRVRGPYGLAGGEPGAPGENWWLASGDESSREPMAAKETRAGNAGDVLRVVTPGGGGWGTDTDPP